MKKTLWFILVFSVGVVTEDADADFTFGEAVNLGPTVNSPAHDMCPRISTDGLSLFFTSARPGGLGGIDAYVATRPSIDAPWLAPVNLGPTVNSTADEHSLSLSADALTLYFTSKRAGGFGRGDLWLTKRTTIDDPWGTPENLGSTVNSPDDELALGISTDGLSLTFTSNRAGGSGGYDLWRTTRATTSDPWGAPVNLGPTVNSSDNEYTLGVSPDDRTLYFSSDRPGVEGWINLWVTRRATLHDDWSEPVPLGPGVNGPSVDGFPVVSTDGQTLYWSSKRDGGAGLVDLWQMPILPVVDFNGDYNVGIKDLLLLIEHWGQNEPSVDIAPGP